MLGIERRQKILEVLQSDRKVYVADLSADFQVTQETIRRDLEKLENDGKVQRSYGGAILAHPSNEDISFVNRAAANYDLKRAIAQKAAALVNDGCTMMLDSSTTALALAELVRAKKDLTVITTSVKILADYASSGMHLISTGGELRAHSLSLVGAIACQTLASYNVDLAVFGCKGLDRDRGVTESNDPESNSKKVMARQAKCRVLLADHTKFDEAGFVKTLDFADVDYVVTDTEPNRKWVDFFEKEDVELL